MDKKFITADDVAGNEFKYVKVPASEIERIVTIKTSGTSGVSKRICFSAEDLRRTIDFFSEGMSYICDSGDTVGIFMPGIHENGVCDLLSKALVNINANPIVYGPVCKFSDLEERLRFDMPNVLIGFPWNIRTLCLMAPWLNPKAILLSGDFIPRNIKKFLKMHWNSHPQIFEHFGMTETCFGFAVQHNENETMCIRRDDFNAHIINPDTLESLPFGEKGELVISTPKDAAMPFENYRTYDLAVMTDQSHIKQVCGRLNVEKQFYDLQETMSELEWLVDYKIDNEISVQILENAPKGCKKIIEELTGMELAETIIFSKSDIPYHVGKR